MEKQFTWLDPTYPHGSLQIGKSFVSNTLQFRPQRRKRRRGESEKKGGDIGILIEGNSEQQKSAEEKLKDRLKAKFGDTHAREEGESCSKRPKITWP